MAHAVVEGVTLGITGGERGSFGVGIWFAGNHERRFYVGIGRWKGPGKGGEGEEVGDLDELDECQDDMND